MEDAIKASSEHLPMENSAIDYAVLVERCIRMGVTNLDDPFKDLKRELLAFDSTAAKTSKALSWQSKRPATPIATQARRQPKG